MSFGKRKSTETDRESAKRRRGYEAEQSVDSLMSIASQTLKKLANLTCSLCEDSYTDPRLLPCSHIFCEPCLEEMVYQDQERPCLCCPTCQRSTVLPLCGTTGVPPAFYVQHLIKIQRVVKKACEIETRNGQCEKCSRHEIDSFCYKCDKFLCKQCISVHKDWEDLSTHETVSLQQVVTDAKKVLLVQVPTRNGKTLYCSKHPRKKLDMFCETDEELICQECSASTHWYHQCDPVSDALSKLKGVIASNLEAIKKQEKDVAKGIKDLDARKVEIEIEEESISDNIQETFEDLHRALQDREKEFTDDLERTTKKKMSSLSCQKEELKLVESQLSSCAQFVRKCQEAGTSSCTEMVARKQHVQIQVEEMSARAYSVQNAAPEEANIAVNSCMLSKLKQIKEIVNSPLTVASVKNDTVHRERNSHERADYRVSKSVNPLVRIIPSRSTTTEHDKSVARMERPVSRRPFGTPIRTITDLNGPWGVTFTRGGQIVVAESGGHRVSIYNRRGKKVDTFGTKGSPNGYFKEPRDVAVDSDGNILVTDARNHRIQKFTPEGEFLKAVGTEQPVFNSQLMPLCFSCPVGIHVDQSDKVYVCDQKNNRVQVLNDDLTFSHNLGTQGFGDSRLKDPWGVAQDSHGNVYVADSQNHLVKVFTEDGKFLRKIGSPGRSCSQLTHPSAVCIDLNDIVYVAERDRETSRVSIFKNDGQFLQSFGGCGDGEGQFREPRGIAVDKSGLIYVTDRDNGRLQIFSAFEDYST